MKSLILSPDYRVMLNLTMDFYNLSDSDSLRLNIFQLDIEELLLIPVHAVVQEQLNPDYVYTGE